MVEVFINVPALTAITKKQSFNIEGSTVKQVICNIEQRYPGFKEKLVDQTGKFQNYMVVAGWYAQIKDALLVSRPEDDRENLIKLSMMVIPSGG